MEKPGDRTVVGFRGSPIDDAPEGTYRVEISFASGRKLVIDNVVDFSVGRVSVISDAIMGQDLHDAEIERIVRQQPAPPSLGQCEH